MRATTNKATKRHGANEIAEESSEVVDELDESVEENVIDEAETTSPVIQ